jgi:hypothetical protein
MEKKIISILRLISSPVAFVIAFLGAKVLFNLFTYFIFLSNEGNGRWQFNQQDFFGSTNSLYLYVIGEVLAVLAGFYVARNVAGENKDKIVLPVIFVIFLLIQPYILPAQFSFLQAVMSMLPALGTFAFMGYKIFIKEDEDFLK